MKRLLTVIFFSLLSLNTEAAGPRDNPLLKPPIPDLPDLYGEEKKDKPESKDDFLPPPESNPALKPRRTPINKDRAFSRGPATVDMRAELQRQLATFDRVSGDPDRALLQLLLAERRGWLTLTRSLAALDAARLYRQLLLPNTAQKLYDSLPAWQTPKEERQSFVLELSHSAYRRGDYKVAEKLLDQIDQPANLQIANEAEGLKLRVLMAQQRYQTISKVFQEALGRPRNNLFTRYNLGVAMVAGGNSGVGIGQLDELGQIAAIDAEPIALRDQANLSLGQAYLQAEQGATARPFFRRIQLNGMAANLGLLGLGWAMLAPDGEPQQKTIIRQKNCLQDPAQLLESTTAVMRRPAREKCGKPKIFRYQRDLEFEPANKDERKQLQAALTPWNQLIKRDAQDMSVQEALLARGYVYERLGAQQQAADAYRLAISKLTEVRKQSSQLQQRIQKNPLSLFDSPPTADLLALANTPVMMETGQSLKALARYQQRLEAAGKRLDKLKSSAATQQTAGKLNRLKARHNALLESYRSVVLRQLNQHFEMRDKQTGLYLRRARLALTQLHNGS